MRNNTVETLIAAFVLAVALGFLFFAYHATHNGSIAGYEIAASMKRIDGIRTGADVRLHGIQIGSVSAVGLEPKTYDALVHMSIRDDIQIPTDSSLSVSSGILGAPFLSVRPGRSAKMIAAGQVWKAD